MDGKIIIGTEIDDKKFDRQIEDLQRKADKKQVEIDITTKNINQLEEQIKRAKEERDAYFKEYEKLLAEQGRFQELARRNTSGLKADALTYAEQKEYGEGIFRDFDYEIEELDKKIQEATVGNFEKLSETLEKQKTKLQDQQYEYKRISERIDEIRQKQERIKIDTVNDNLKNVGKSLTSIVKKVGKWGLALLGIRAVYGFIRNAVNQIAQEDATMQNQIKYINYAVGTALKPVLEFILNIIYKIIAGIGGVIKLLTGINIFSKATASNFAKANSNAKSLKKTLAGFDEMNILNEDGSVGLLGTGEVDVAKLKDLSTEVETMSKKMKDWFKITFPSRQQIEETYKPMREFWGGLGKWFDETVINPMTNSFKDFAEVTEPLWKPVADGFKEAFGPLYNYANENFLKPLSEKLSTYKDNFLSKYAKFINKIIYYINFAFGAFGVNLEYIDEESALTGEDIKKNIGDSLDKVKEKAENAKTPFDSLHDKLKELTSKAWNIVTNFTSNGLSKNTMNDWLQPLRERLAQIGIKLPRLAKGGIINMPGRGVPVGGGLARGGEVAPEGVIPLTDSQQMALLGEAIGKYITINANITNTMNGRVISRELQRVQNQSDFTMNR